MSRPNAHKPDRFRNNLKFLLFIAATGTVYFLVGKMLALGLEVLGLCKDKPAVFSRNGFVDCPGKYFLIELAVEGLPIVLALIFAISLLRRLIIVRPDKHNARGN